MRYLFSSASVFESAHLKQLKLYVSALVFTAGNVIFPAMVHSFPNGGKMFLPLFFFTLIASARYGLIAGLAVAVLSPLANFGLTGMPPVQMLPVILAKSSLLALSAWYFIHRTRNISICAILAAVVFSQISGGLFQAAWAGSFVPAIADLRLAGAGIILQIFGGFAFFTVMNKYADKRNF